MEYLKSMTEIGLAEPVNDRLTVETSHPDNSTLIVQSRKKMLKTHASCEIECSEISLYIFKGLTLA